MSKQNNPFEQAVQRVYDKTDFKTPVELQEYLGISRQAFSKAKNSYSMPKRWAQQFQEDYGLNSEWILTGKGDAWMKDFHRQLSQKVYIIRDAAMSIQHDIGRYGTATKEAHFSAQLSHYVEKLRDRLDERAFKECPDVPKEERLKIYYQGQSRELIDFAAIDQKGNLLTAECKPISSTLAMKVEQAEKAHISIDPDATEAEILDAVIAALTNRRNKLGPKPYAPSYAREVPIAHEDTNEFGAPNTDNINSAE